MTGVLGTPIHFAPKKVPHLPHPSSGPALGNARDELEVGHSVREKPTMITMPASVMPRPRAPQTSSPLSLTAALKEALSSYSCFAGEETGSEGFCNNYMNKNTVIYVLAIIFIIIIRSRY